MIDFDWSNTRAAPLEERYPADWEGSEAIIGLRFWKDFVSMHPEAWSPEFLQSLLPRHPPFSAKRSTIGNCRVFISHSRHDLDKAQDIARIVRHVGWNYWLDVEDPNLRMVNATISQGSMKYALAVAAIIEFALLNCTHVISVLTDKTLKSTWVPYEFGRVKPRKPSAPAALCRAYPGNGSFKIPDYYVLNPICTDNRLLEHCLRNSVRKT